MFPPAKFKESLYLALDDPEGIADSHEVESVDKEKEPDAAPNSEASRIPLTKTSPGLFGRPNIVGKVNQFISRSSVTATGALSSTCTVNSQITGGYLLNRGAYSVGLVTGAFSVETLGYTGPAPLQDLAGDINITFNASRVSTLFGAASTIQTASLRSLALIRAY